MRRRILIVTAIGAVGWLAGCGGGSNAKGAASASSAGSPSTLSITQVSDAVPEPKFSVTGPAYGFFAPDMGAFNVFVVDAAGAEAPDCDHLKQLRETQKGRFVDLWLSGNVSAPGTQKVAGAMYIDATGGGNEAKAGNGRADDVSLDFRSIDAHSFDAVVVSGSGAASGTVHGIVCDVAKVAPGAASGAAGGVPAEAMAPAPPDPTAAANDGPTSFQLQVGNALNDVEGELALVKLDPKTKMLGVVVWPAHMAAPTTCDTFTAKRGTNEDTQNAFFWVKNASAKPGKYPLYAAEETFVESNGPSAVFAAHDGTLDVSQFDDKKLVATLQANSKLVATGKITADVCAAGHIEVPAEDKLYKPAGYQGGGAKPSKTAKGKKKK